MKQNKQRDRVPLIELAPPCSVDTKGKRNRRRVALCTIPYYTGRRDLFELFKLDIKLNACSARVQIMTALAYKCGLKAKDSALARPHSKQQPANKSTGPARLDAATVMPRVPIH
ncbi:hypothetical protein KQX54_005555 [Cotesia glomerata]|uniref:Uncharacterized protein n=1 Tax=Cotesia glomerata TaxID=32391 RepID=A0AAV7I7G2_COTGL|nr:hypothetical protein KQX54_005555 [Cotesia glomerata]